MNRRDLNQIYYYKQEIKMWEEERRRLKEESEVKSPSLDGMPRSQKISDPTGRKGVTLADIDIIIEDLEYRALVKTKEIYEFMRDIDDSMMRQIIKYRCIELLSWKRVAMKIGGGNTEDGVRMAFNRFFE